MSDINSIAIFFTASILLVQTPRPCKTIVLIRSTLFDRLINIFAGVALASIAVKPALTEG